MRNSLILLCLVLLSSSCGVASHVWYQPVFEEDVNFVRDPKVDRKCTYTNSKDTVLLMQGFIDPKYFVVLEDPAIQFSIKGGTVDLSHMFSEIYLQIGNSLFVYTPQSGDSKALFSGSTRIEKWTSVKMFAHLRHDICLDSDVQVRFSTLRLSDFSLREYACNGDQVESTLGGIPGIAVKLGISQ